MSVISCNLVFRFILWTRTTDSSSVLQMFGCEQTWTDSSSVLQMFGCEQTLWLFRSLNPNFKLICIHWVTFSLMNSLVAPLIELIPVNLLLWVFMKCFSCWWEWNSKFLITAVTLEPSVLVPAMSEQQDFLFLFLSLHFPFQVCVVETRSSDYTRTSITSFCMFIIYMYQNLFCLCVLPVCQSWGEILLWFFCLFLVKSFFRNFPWSDLMMNRL